MSQADELLDSLEETTPSLLLADSETEPHIIISGDRIISVPKQLQRIAVQYDHNVETVTFDCPRYWDGLDMSQLGIYINYRRSDRVVGCYKATDITIDDADTSIMHFNWTIYRSITEVIGPLVFLVCVKKMDGDGNEENHWNSELNTEMYISEGLEASETMLEPYPDIISQWEEEVQAVKDILLAARDSGELDGATFTPSVDTNGNLSWTNDKGRKNPATVNVKGYSPRILVKNIDGGHRLTITDNVESQTVDVMNGTDGYSPGVLVRNIDGGHELVVTDRAGSKTIQVMDGVDGTNGTNGANGKDGVSPTISSKTITGGHQITLTDADGTQIFTVWDGADGKNGYSPELIINDTRDEGQFVRLTFITKRENDDGTVTSSSQEVDVPDGFSPKVTVTAITGGHRVAITDYEGTRAFNVMDGTDGKDGAGSLTEDDMTNALMNFISIGSTEPTSGPVLWFDTSAENNGTMKYKDRDGNVSVMFPVTKAANIDGLTVLLNQKAAISHTHTKSQISDFPRSMPASDVSSWAKASTKPTYTASEVGADAKGSAAQALTNAKSYTDEKVADAKGSAAQALTDAKSYTDKQVADAKGYTDKQVAAAKSSAAQALTDAKSYTDEKVADSQKLDLPISASSTDGVAYAATVPGITALTAGQSFIMVPERQSADMSCTLNVNSLGAKRIIIRGTGYTNTTAVPFATNWLAAATPVRVTYNGARWVADVVAPDDRVSYGTSDLTAGTSTLATGHLYFVYE